MRNARGDLLASGDSGRAGRDDGRSARALEDRLPSGVELGELGGREDEHGSLQLKLRGRRHRAGPERELRRRRRAQQREVPLA